jgi:hypothetical protein
MTEKRKLQVFVSSTFIDLKEERQAAVQAILTAGHIPAGMELFSAGDQSQMDVIKRWIDESDIFLLILGGRYGSIESESQKSYTHLEYEYALEKGKALFAVVTDQKALEERVKTSELGFKLIESDNQHKLKEFRNLVSSKMVRFWSDSKDIKLAILETLSEFSRREELIGWIPGNQAVNTGELAEELARLAKENSELREQVNNLSSQLANNQAIFNGLTYEEMYQSLNKVKLDFNAFNPQIKEQSCEILRQISIAFGDSEVSFLHCFWSMRNLFGRPNLSYDLYESILQDVIKFGLFKFEGHNVERHTHPLAAVGGIGLTKTLVVEYIIKLSECGQNFLNCLIKDKKNNLEANKLFLPKKA